MVRAIRRMAVATLLWALIPVCAASQIPPPPPPPPPAPAGGPPGQPREATGLIVGRVVDAGSGRPVAGATVSAAAASRVLTDADGQFVFFRVPKGTFSLTASKTGYVDGAYGRLRPNGSSTPLEMAEGERMADVTIPVWKVAVISGTLADEAGEPVVGIDVRAYRRTLAGGRRRLTMQQGVATDDRGMFRLANLPPGDYVVGVESTTVAVPSDVADAYRAAITGTDPARQALMREMSSIRASPIGMRIGTMITGSGYGRTTGLPLIDAGGRVFAYPTTFYPASTSAAQATVVTLGSGEERSGIDMQLKPVPTVRVSGIVSGPEGPVTYVGLRLIPAASDVMATDLEAANTMSDGSGAFTFLGVTPGQYVVKVTKQPPPQTPDRGASTIIQSGSGTMVMTFSGDANAPPPPLPVGNALWAAMPLSVGASDLQDVAIALRSGIRVTGRVEFEGSAAAPKPDAMQRIQVFLEPASPGDPRGMFPMLRGRVETDGRFSTASLPGGKYYLRAGGPPGWSFKSATHEGRDLADVPLDAAADMSGVVITFTDRPSELTGTVLGTGGAADTGAIVLLFPSDAAAWTEWGINPRRLRAVRPQANGTFRAANLPSGDYYAIAVPDEVSSDWQDQKVLETLARGATLVRIEDGQKKTLSLRVSDIARVP